MAYPIGNDYYKRALNVLGRKPRFETPEALKKEAMDYFQWVEDNPLYEHKAFGYTGTVVVEKLPVIRAMTIHQFCLFVGVSKSGWNSFCKRIRDNEKYPARHDFLAVIDAIESVIYTQKFQAAAGNLLNANIISRDLGLVDKSEVDESLQVTWQEQKTYIDIPHTESFDTEKSQTKSFDRTQKAQKLTENRSKKLIGLKGKSLLKRKNS